MSSDAHFGGDSRRNSLSNIPAKCYDVLRHPRRLRVLEILGSTGREMTVSELVTEIRARDGSGELSERQLRTSLVHSHLPRLADHDIIIWDGETASVGTNAPLPPMNVAVLLEACSSTDEKLLETVVHPVRMPTLRLLEEHAQGCSIDILAEQLATLEVDTISDSQTAKIALHHSHLPALADIDVLEYENGWVKTTDHPLPTMH
ncbi:DUF7344 domain-containing protein [Halostagnicola bangensis]